MNPLITFASGRRDHGGRLLDFLRDKVRDYGETSQDKGIVRCVGLLLRCAAILERVQEVLESAARPPRRLRRLIPVCRARPDSRIDAGREVQTRRAAARRELFPAFSATMVMAERP